MTGLPDFLTDQPERAMSLDLVSDVLRAVRLDGAYFYKVTASAPWCVESSTEDAGAAAVLPGSEHLIPYHVLVEGRCWAGAPGSPLREMRAGDVVVFPRGGPQRLASGPGVRPSVEPVRFPVPERLPFRLDLGGKGPARATFVCGFLGCDRRPFNPVLDALPQVLFAGGAGGGLLGAFREQALQEVDAGRAGGELVVTRLAELMFIEVIRSYVQGLPADQPGWFAGLRDGVFVAAGDTNGDGIDEIITGAGGGGSAHVKEFDGTTLAVRKSFYAFAPSARDGVTVATTDRNSDGLADIAAGTAVGVQAQVKFFNATTGQEDAVFNAFDLGFVGGVFVG